MEKIFAVENADFLKDKHILNIETGYTSNDKILINMDVNFTVDITTTKITLYTHSYDAQECIINILDNYSVKLLAQLQTIMESFRRT